MKPTLFYLVFVLLSVNIFAQTNELSRISVKGNKFITADEKPIIFRGLDTSDPDKLARDGHWNKAYFEEMKAWGANIVRFPVHPRAWRSQGKVNYMKLLDDGSSHLSTYASGIHTTKITVYPANRWLISIPNPL